MKFTFDWLRDHLDTTATLDQIVDETADVLAFLLWQTGAPGFALPGPTSTGAPKD